ncbi:MAG: zinc finger domain-containing protein, partial [Vicinamibacterales bacterium]
WRHLPGSREISVHLAEFPSDAEIDGLLDADLTARWERLKGVRDNVNVALEARRKDKTIGTSLGAKVTVRAGGDTAALLARHRAELPMLFIVSQVTLDTSGAADQPLEVVVERADGDKCARCWRIVDRISSDAATEGICDRCVVAVAASA